MHLIPPLLGMACFVCASCAQSTALTVSTYFNLNSVHTVHTVHCALSALCALCALSTTSTTSSSTRISKLPTYTVNKDFKWSAWKRFKNHPCSCPGFVSRPGLAAFWIGAQIAHSFAEERARFLGRRPCVVPKICIPPWAGGIPPQVLLSRCRRNGTTSNNTSCT